MFPDTTYINDIYKLVLLCLCRKWGGQVCSDVSVISAGLETEE